ncbi:MAG: hypothetical protein ACREKE_04715, partial [bacterium]
AIPKFAQMLEKSREGATKGNLGGLKSAVSTYYADQQGNYPQTQLGTDTWYYSPLSATYPAFIPNYMDNLPTVRVTAQNTINNTNTNAGPGVGNSAGEVTTGTWGSPAFASDSSGSGWKYDNTAGSIWVNSELIDMENNSYTIYGYQ